MNPLILTTILTCFTSVLSSSLRNDDSSPYFIQRSASNEYKRSPSIMVPKSRSGSPEVADVSFYNGKVSSSSRDLYARTSPIRSADFHKMIGSRFRTISTELDIPDSSKSINDDDEVEENSCDSSTERDSLSMFDMDEDISRKSAKKSQKKNNSNK